MTHVAEDLQAVIRTQFAEYLDRSGIYFGPQFEQMLLYNNDLAWLELKSMGCKLAKIAVRLFRTITTFVPSERSFSATNYIHNKIRNRLRQSHVNQQTFIYMNEKMLKFMGRDLGGQAFFPYAPICWENAPIKELFEIENFFVAWEGQQQLYKSPK